MSLVESRVESKWSYSSAHLDHLLLAQLRLPIGPHWIQHHAVLPPVQRGHLHHAHHLLRDRGHVSLTVHQCYQPFLTRPPLTTSNVLEGPNCSHVKGLLQREGEGSEGNCPITAEEVVTSPYQR